MSVSEDPLMADDLSSIAGTDQQQCCPVHGGGGGGCGGGGGGIVANLRRAVNAPRSSSANNNNNNRNAAVDLADDALVRRCNCARKGQLPDMHAAAAVHRDNAKRHSKSQHEQLRQYKDEARHLSKVSRAFREENNRLQRVLEEKSRLAAEATDRATRERRRHMDADGERAAWFVRIDDLRDENDVLSTMASKSRSEAEHLRAALEQAMGENLKLRSAMQSSAGGSNTNNNNNFCQTAAAPATTVGPSSLFLQDRRASSAGGGGGASRQTSEAPTGATTKPSVVAGQLPPPVSSSHHQQHARPASAAAAAAAPNNNNNNKPSSSANRAAAAAASSSSSAAYVGLAEDLNNLRTAVNFVRNLGCTCREQSPTQQQQQQQSRGNSPPQATSGGSGSGIRDRCSVGLGKHRFSPAEGGGPLLSPSEKLDEALDAVRRRAFAMERELQQAAADADRWQQSAMELKGILDSVNAGGGGASAGQHHQQYHHQQQQYAPPRSSSPPKPSGKVDLPGPNPRSATAGVTNLESQLEWAKGQIATLDFQLQTAHKHTELELEKLRKAKDEEIRDARREAAGEVEARLREEVRRTTSGGFLEELSTKLQEAERKIESLEMAATASEGTKKKQRADIETLTAKLESTLAVAEQLEPTQRELSQAQEDRRVLDIRLRNAEGTIDALRSTEAKLAEESSALRVRASKAEERCAQLQDDLNQVSLKLHLEVESNNELKERLEDTVARYEATTRESRMQMEEQLHSAQDRLRSEASHRVTEEARASALENNLRSVREEVERIRRVQLHW